MIGDWGGEGCTVISDGGGEWRGGVYSTVIGDWEGEGRGVL